MTGEVRKVWAHGNLIEVETLDTGAAPKHVRSRKRHTKFPGIWEDVLAKAHVSAATYTVAIVLLYEAWRLASRGYKPIVKVSDVMMKRVHVGRRGKRNALRKLGQLRLVEIEWRGNRNPLATVCFLD
jgi:hypothetical protein